ncbi:acylphosphatase [Homoserinibacter sp. YIM 151385]|uniref:acylphosphatase n=1 Tax=Homoserinibacter sp. YIM 151385 TaxID=2985506 RepID=UPI0022F0BEF7|nr:acylphosphatase [Homoserinibacter sp. YIM 151385]WBU38377.1 acylphosphatase [Homoserinibacter sp. YIM 151385]
MGTRIRRHAIVSGVVQGVGFRWSTRREAERLELDGFARNREDGTVEVEAEGPEDRVAQLLEWLRVGPPGAEVAEVRVVDQPLGARSGFRIG